MAGKKPRVSPVVQAKAEVITLMALATNDTITAAAKELGINRNTLYERIEKYGLKEKLSSIQEMARLELITGAGKAARNLVAKIDHENPDISLRSSTEILDRIGATKQNRNGTEGNTINNFGQILMDQRDKYSD